MKNAADLKPLLHAACLKELRERIRTARAGIALLRDTGDAETKSSAGDKHETGRAMAQLEWEKQTTALHHLLEMEKAFLRTDPMAQVNRLSTGALVETDQGLFYVVAALGSIMVEGRTAQVISMQAPLANALSGLQAGEAVNFRGRSYRLLQIR